MWKSCRQYIKAWRSGFLISFCMSMKSKKEIIIYSMMYEWIRGINMSTKHCIWWNFFLPFCSIFLFFLCWKFFSLHVLVWNFWESWVWVWSNDFGGDSLLKHWILIREAFKVILGLWWYDIILFFECWWCRWMLFGNNFSFCWFDMLRIPHFRTYLSYKPKPVNRIN